jgi:hypothetical protein
VSATPGPWAVVDRHPDKATFYIISAEHEVAVVYRVHDSDDERHRADANLIAAAPEQQAKIDELAEALAVMTAIVELQNGNRHDDTNTAIAQARAALRQAGRLP